MTEKTTRWQFTAYESQYAMISQCPMGVAKIGFQDEVCPTTNRNHRQGYILLKEQQRFSWMKKTFPGLHVEVARNWQALVQYCKKEATRAEGAVFTEIISDIPNKFVYAEEIADRLACIQRATPIIREDVDFMVQMDVASGRRGVMWIGCDPNWTTMWNKYFDSMIKAARGRQTDRQTAETNLPEVITNAPSPSSPEPSPWPQGQEDSQVSGLTEC